MSPINPFTRAGARFSQSGARDGVALLAVLACILLLTILIISFISFTRLNRASTFEYGNSVQAQEIAQGGLQDIISDLHQEIVAGSMVSGSPATFVVNGTPVYVPTTNYTAQPARIGYAPTAWATNMTASAFAPSLVRVSRRAASDGDTKFNPPLSTTYYPGTLPLNRASAVSTATASVDGRSISPARWNKTFLLAANAAAVPTPFTAASSPTTPTGPPDWVYVTRTGSQALPNTAATVATVTPSAIAGATKTPVVGRYSFVMYDEGALLDANVAGYVSGAVNQVSTADPTTGMTQAINGKSFLASADLTQLPGLNVIGGQNIIDNLVELRNNSSNIGNPTGNSTSTASNTTYGKQYLLSLISYSTNSFLNFATTGNGSDSPFLGRQDLINYFASVDSNINTTSPTFSQALPYLGTFSRATSAPTYAPPLDPSSIPNYIPALATVNPAPTYNSSMEVSGTVNRDLANVRYSSNLSAGTIITHYSDDATTALYSVNGGDPLLENRFSLAKIAWLSKAPVSSATGPPSPYDTAIHSCFGLVWGTVGTMANGGNACWKYVGSQPGAGATAAAFSGTIETLDQVAKEAREPNFFEVLKAAILNGSMGLCPGHAAFDDGKLDTGQSGNSDYANNQGDYQSVNGGDDNIYSLTYDGHVTGQTGTVPNPSAVSDIQIMQIGANIIDQFDADSYPTAIYFPYSYQGTQLGAPYDAASATYLGEFGPTDIIFGDENIPALEGLLVPTCTTDGTTTTRAPNLPDGTPGAPITYAPLGAWWQPELWNPHQQPAAGYPVSPPLKFIIRAYGNSKHFETASGSPGSNSTPLTGQEIDFTANSSASLSAFCITPTLLTQNLPGITVTTTSTAPGVPASTMLANSSMNDFTLNEFAGFSLGIDTQYCALNLPASTNYSALGSPIASFALGWSSTGTDFHPYSFISGVFAYSYGKDQYYSPQAKATAMSVDPEKDGGGEEHKYLDPRTHRFGTYSKWQTADNTTLWPNNGAYARNVVQSGWGVPPALNFVYSTVNGNGLYAEDWQANGPPSGTSNAVTPYYATSMTDTYYSDPDGIVRPADGFYANSSTGDGLFTFTSAGTATTPVGDNTAIQHGRRPVILNRPFRSVGELGYVFRDLPFKTLNFFSASSADAGLLDVFSINDQCRISAGRLNSVTAGQVNISNAPWPVLQSMLVGGSKKDLDPTYNITGTETTIGGNKVLATAILMNLNPATGPRPLLNRAALVTQIMPIIQTVKASGTLGSSFGSKADESNKSYLESPIRALSEDMSTRTWNLLIDIISQSGQIAPGATSLSNFTVQGEKRYWLHVSIDRYTGKIIAQNLEPVYE